MDIKEGGHQRGWTTKGVDYKEGGQQRWWATKMVDNKDDGQQRGWTTRRANNEHKGGSTTAEVVSNMIYMLLLWMVDNEEGKKQR